MEKVVALYRASVGERGVRRILVVVATPEV